MQGEKRTEIVAKIAYLIGVEKDKLENHYDQTLLNELYENKEATIVRYLCNLRSTLFNKFKVTDREMRYHLANIDRLEWFNKEEIAQLRKWGIEVVKVNYTSQKYIEDFSELITKHIDACKDLFNDWVDFNYVKALFVIPKKKNGAAYKGEFAKYMANLDNYPFQRYIFWEPYNCGNMLLDDEKFMGILYRLHDDSFEDKSKVRELSDESKGNIYEFIEKADKTVIVVDCENSDPYKLYGVLKNLDAESHQKIEKIILYDDNNTEGIWSMMGKYINIPVEHNLVERVLESKSLVDMKMTAGVCEAYYKYGIDSFILCSSDSDFWALITSLPFARFIVLHEDLKCSPMIKDTMETHNILNCSMDDFYSGNATGLKKRVLLKQLQAHLPEIVGTNGKELAQKIYEEAMIFGTAKEVDDFYNKYIKTLRLKIDADGVFYVDICE